MNESGSKFGAALAEAVREGLNRIGPSATDAVLFYMHKKAAVQLDGHDLDPEAFDGCLKGLFGWGAEMVERKILECLYQKLEAHTKLRSGFVFADEVKKARKLSHSAELLATESANELARSLKSARKALLVNNKGQTL